MEKVENDLGNVVDAVSLPCTPSMKMRRESARTTRDSRFQGFQENGD
jgi:hypothetical protein